MWICNFKVKKAQVNKILQRSWAISVFPEGRVQLNVTLWGLELTNDAISILLNVIQFYWEDFMF